VRIVFMGSPVFAANTLVRLIEEGHKIAAVYTRTDKPAGRGRLPAAPPVKEAAIKYDLPVVQVPTLKSSPAVEQLASYEPDAIVVAAFGQMLPQAVLDIPEYGCLNIHPSLLPQYRGPSPVASALLHGDAYAGVSIMKLDAGMDSGPVFTQAQIPVTDYDTTESLTPKLFTVGTMLLLETLANLPKGKLVPVPQDHSAATFTSEINKEDGLIDWQLSSVEICRKVRAYYPWPGAYTKWQGKQLKITGCLPDAAEEKGEPGKVVALHSSSKTAFGIIAGEGVLGVLSVQIEGKRRMDAEEFLRGHSNLTGAVLG
jgi:methionyl-tRNA formyltransferase